MYIFKFDIDKNTHRPIVIPQTCNKVIIHKSKYGKDKLTININHNKWDFNKFDMLTAIRLISGAMTIDDLKDKYDKITNSKVRKVLIRFIKFLIKNLKLLENKLS